MRNYGAGIGSKSRGDRTFRSQSFDNRAVQREGLRRKAEVKQRINAERKLDAQRKAEAKRSGESNRNGQIENFKRETKGGGREERNNRANFDSSGQRTSEQRDGDRAGSEEGNTNSYRETPQRENPSEIIDERNSQTVSDSSREDRTEYSNRDLDGSHEHRDVANNTSTEESDAARFRENTQIETRNERNSPINSDSSREDAIASSGEDSDSSPEIQEDTSTDFGNHNESRTEHLSPENTRTILIEDRKVQGTLGENSFRIIVFNPDGEIAYLYKNNYEGSVSQLIENLPEFEGNVETGYYPLRELGRRVFTPNDRSFSDLGNNNQSGEQNRDLSENNRSNEARIETERDAARSASSHRAEDIQNAGITHQQARLLLQGLDETDSLSDDPLAGIDNEGRPQPQTPYIEQTPPSVPHRPEDNENIDITGEQTTDNPSPLSENSRESNEDSSPLDNSETALSNLRDRILTQIPILAQIRSIETALANSSATPEIIASLHQQRERLSEELESLSGSNADTLSGSQLDAMVAQVREQLLSTSFPLQDRQLMESYLQDIEAELGNRQAPLIAAREVAQSPIFQSPELQLARSLLTGFFAHAYFIIPGTSADELKREISDSPREFSEGVNAGIPQGVVEGLKSTLQDLGKLIELIGELFSLRVNERIIERLTEYIQYPDRFATDVNQAQDTIEGLRELGRTVLNDPNFISVHGEELGELVGREAGEWFDGDFMNRSTLEKGKTVGNVAGRIILEIAMSILFSGLSFVRGASATSRAVSEVGNVAGGTRASEGLRGAVMEAMQRIPGLRRFMNTIRELIADESGGVTIGNAISRTRNSERDMSSGRTPESTNNLVTGHGGTNPQNLEFRSERLDSLDPGERTRVLEAARGNRQVLRALCSSLERFPKLQTDSETLSELASLFRGTIRQEGSYQRLRADAGELAWLRQMNDSPNVSRIRFLRPVRVSGARTSDMEIMLSNGGSFNLEVTTLTRGGRADKERYDRHGQAGLNHPSPDILPRTLSGQRREVYNKFKAKLKRGQAANGIIAVRINGTLGHPLSNSQIANLRSALNNNARNPANVQELWIQYRDNAGRYVTELIASRSQSSSIYDQVLGN